MNEQKFKTFALTFRPRNGVEPFQLPLISDWIKKRSEYYHVITESEGPSLHVHAALYLKVAVRKSDFATVWIRVCKKLGLDPEELSVQRKGIKILYNNDFVDKYLTKDDLADVICSNLPESHFLESWYPPKPVDPVVSRARKCSTFYWNLESLWYKHSRPELEINRENCEHFLFNMMYNERCINVMRDDKTIRQTARHLSRWLNKTSESCMQELAPFEKDE